MGRGGERREVEEREREINLVLEKMGKNSSSIT
jgi:hypothetical protein